MNSVYHSYGFMLAKISERMEEILDKHLSAYGLNARQFALLLVIKDNQGITQTQTGELLQIDRTTTAKQVDYLEDANYIFRIQNPKNRRSYVLNLTNIGENLIQEGFKVLKQTEREVLKQLSKEEKTLLKSLIHYVD